MSPSTGLLCLFPSHRIVIRKSQRNRRFAPKQLHSSNYKTLGKCWADALRQYAPPHPPAPSFPLAAFQLREPFGLILVLHWLHMQWRSLPNGCHGINEPNRSPTRHTVRWMRTKEELPLQLKCSAAPRCGAWRLCLPLLRSWSLSRRLVRWCQRTCHHLLMTNGFSVLAPYTWQGFATIRHLLVERER